MGVIMLVAPMVILSIFTLTGLILAVIGMYKANRALPRILRNTGNKIVGVNETSRKYINDLASPVIRARSVSAGAKEVFKVIQKRLWRK